MQLEWEKRKGELGLTYMRETFNEGEIGELTQTLVKLFIAARRGRIGTVFESEQSERVRVGFEVLGTLWVSLRPNRVR